MKFCAFVAVIANLWFSRSGAKSIHCSSVPLCPQYQLIAARYPSAPLSLNAALNLTLNNPPASLTTWASLNGNPFSFRIPYNIMVNSTATSLVATGAILSGQIDLILLTGGGVPVSLYCVYIVNGTENSNFFWSQCTTTGAVQFGFTTPSPGNIVTASYIQLKVLGRQDQLFPGNIFVQWFVSAVSTATQPCEPYTPSQWQLVAGAPNGAQIFAGSPADPNVTSTYVCETIVASTTQQPAVTISYPGIAASSVNPGSTSQPSSKNWLSSLGSISSTIIISVAVFSIVLVLSIIVFCILKRAKLIDQNNKFYTPSKGDAKVGKMVMYYDGQSPMGSGFSMDASRDTVVDMSLCYDPNDSYWNNLGDGQDFDAVHNMNRASIDMVAPYGEYSAVVPRTISNASKFPQTAQDCTLMNTRAEISLPGFLRMDYHNDLRPDIVIAEGGGGVVYQAELLDERIKQKHRTSRVIVKLVKNSGQWSHDELLNHFRQEVSIMWSLSFLDHVIRLIGYSEEPMAIVTKLYAKSMMDLIQDPQSAYCFTPRNCLRFAFHVAYAMSEIHNLGIVHRDLKSANLLLDIPPASMIPTAEASPESVMDPSLDPTFWKVIVCDFGLAKIHGDTGIKASKITDVQGISVRYAAPEVFSKLYLHMISKSAKSSNPNDQKSAALTNTMNASSIGSDKGMLFTSSTESAGQPGADVLENAVDQDGKVNPKLQVSADEERKHDIYAFAIIVWEILYRDVCWKGLKNDEIEWNVRNGHRPPVQSPDSTDESNEFEAALISTMSDCWSQDPSWRPEFQALRNHLEPLYSKLPQPNMASMGMSSNGINPSPMQSNNASRLFYEPQSVGRRSMHNIPSQFRMNNNSGTFGPHSTSEKGRPQSLYSPMNPHQRSRTAGSHLIIPGHGLRSYMPTYQANTVDAYRAARSRHMTATLPLSNTSLDTLGKEI